MPYAEPPKKTLILNILEILQKYSDDEHRLSQSDILAKLKTDYSMKVDRKAVRRNILELIESGYDIAYELKERKNYNEATGEYADNSIYYDFRLIRELDDSELRLLIDSVIFSPHIPAANSAQLVEKLKKLSSVHFKTGAQSIEVINPVTSQNKNWFLTLDELNEAITNRCAVRFTYNEYGEDKLLHPVEQVTVRPYRIIAHNGHYYLLSNEPPFDNIVHYRVDRITDIKLLKDDTFPQTPPFDVNEYVRSHPFMFSGKKERIRITADRSVLEDVFDWFGDDVNIISSKDDHLEIILSSAITDFYYWALRYGDAVEVISPKELRYRIRETVETMTRAYLKNKDDKVQRSLGKADKSGVLDLRHPEMRDAKIDRIPEGLEELIIDSSYTHDVSFISRIRGLKRLKVYNHTDDFSFLKGMDSLTELSLHNTGFNDMSVIRGLHLEKLYLDEASVDHLDLVYEMPSLKELWLTRSLANTIDIKLLKERNPQINVDLISGGNIRTYLRRPDEPGGSA